MIIDGVPGLTIHEHEGRLAGTFELPPADLAAIEFNGRVMLVIVADVGAPFRVTTDLKEDINTAHWTMKSVDAAIVRTESLRNLLVEALHLDAADVDIVPVETEGPQEAWSLTPETLQELGSVVTTSSFDNDAVLTPVNDAILTPTNDAVNMSVLESIDDEEDLETLDGPVSRIVEDEEEQVYRVPPVSEEIEELGAGETKQRFGAPIRPKDPTLAKYLDDDRDFARSGR